VVRDLPRNFYGIEPSEDHATDGSIVNSHNRRRYTDINITDYTRIFIL